MKEDIRAGFFWFYHWKGLTKIKSDIQKLLISENIISSEIYCKKDIPFCYSRESNDRLKLLTCTLCNLRRIYSSCSNKSINIGSLNTNFYSDNKISEYALSSVNTLIGSEDPVILKNPILDKEVIDKINFSIEKTKISLLNYLNEEKINFGFVLNGRMDILRLASNLLGERNISFLTFERSLLNKGLMIYPNANCLDKNFTKAIINVRKQIPLRKERFNNTLNLMKERISKSLKGEIFEFQKRNINYQLKVKKKYKISFLLSSESEFYQDNMMGWNNVQEAFSKIVNEFGPNAVCFKGHPLWSNSDAQLTKSKRDIFKENLKSDTFYERFCENLGVEYIPSYSSKSSLEIAQLSKIVVLQNSTIFYELAFLNIPIITIKDNPEWISARSVIPVRNMNELLKNKNKIEYFLSKHINTLNEEETINDAVNIFHSIAYDQPLFHSDICQTTFEVREAAMKNFILKINNSKNLFEIYKMLLKSKIRV